MKVAELRIDVSPGLFSTERVATFQGDGRLHTVLVDQEILDGNRLRVYVLETDGDRAFIHLPRETLDGAARVIVPLAELESIRDARLVLQ